MFRVSGVLIITAIFFSALKVQAQNQCEPETNRLLHSWHLLHSPMMTDRTTSLGVRQIGHTELNYKAMERNIYSSKESAEKENLKTFNEWPKMETPIFYGQRVSIKDSPPHGVSLQYEGLKLTDANGIRQYSFKHFSLSFDFNSACKIEKIHFPASKFTLTAQKCREIRGLPILETLQAIDPAQHHHLEYHPLVLNSIREQCRNQSVVMEMLVTPGYEPNRRIASDSKIKGKNKK